jgi:hypothetical protein
VTEEMVSRDTPKRAAARVADLELLVRVPSRPETIRAFTRAETALAEQYAARFDGAAVIEPLG